MRRRVTGAVIACTFVLTLAGCSTGSEVDLGSGAPSTGDNSAVGVAASSDATTPSGGDVATSSGSTSGVSGSGTQLVAAIAGEPDQLDPQKTTSYFAFEVLENVYDTLVEPDAKGKMQADLATSWTVSKDELTWTFTLRKGVHFQDGATFSSADVVYSFDRIINDKLSASWRFASVASVKASGPDTVVIKVKSPTPNLLTLIGGYKGMAIVEKSNVTDGKIARSPIGTGPFSVSQWVSGDHITLTANKDFWGPKPKLSSIEFRFISDGSTAITALKNNEVQWTDSIPPQRVKSLKSDTSITLSVTPSNDYYYLALNEQHKPWNNISARQAIAYAIDRPAIIQATTYGTGVANQLAIPKQSQWYTAYDKYNLDPAMAKQLFAQAGYTGGTLNFLATSDYPETVTAAQVIAANLKQYGITVKITTVDFATFLSDESAGKYDMYMMSWVGNLDPAEYYYAQQHTDGVDNFQHYSNKAVDKLLDAGATETDPASRKQDYAQAAIMIANDASYIYLYNPAVIQAWSPALAGYQARSDKAIRFDAASLGQ